MRNERLNKVDKVRIRGEPRDDEAERMRKVEPVVTKGKTWYRLRDICNALRIDPEYAGQLVEPPHKVRQYEYHGGYRSMIYALVDREGADAIITRYCSGPRGEILDALRK